MAPLTVIRTAGVPVRRSAIALVASALLALTLLGGLDGAPAAQAAPERCDGVWVVVDAGALGGPTSVRCARTERPIDGVEALTRAGHTVSDVPGQPGMICRIDRRPDPCPGTPPADAYWSYWLAEPGGTWRYSQFGATFREAQPGTVDAWAFGAGDPPSIPPPRPAPAREPAPSEADRDTGSSDDRSTSGSGGGTRDRGGPSGDDGGAATSDRGSVASPEAGGDERDATRDEVRSSAPAEADAGARRDRRAGASDGGGDGAGGDGDEADVSPSLGPDERRLLSDGGATTGDARGEDRGDEPSDHAGEDRSDPDADGEVLLSRGPDGDGGSLAPVAVGGGLLAGLAGTAAWTARRRGTGDPDPTT